MNGDRMKVTQQLERKSDMKQPSKFIQLCVCSALCGSLLLLVGCESEEGGPSARERQDAALKDPFSYNPDAELMSGPKKGDVDPTDISGGGTGNLDKKALKRDWDTIWNP